MKRNLLLLTMLVLFSACESQLGTTIGSTISNVFSGKAFINSSGDEAYNSMKKEAASTPSTSSITPTCASLDSIVPITDKDSGNMSQIKDKLCTCAAWGTCDSKSCSCENLCPKDFKIIKKLAAPSDAVENTLSFTNTNNKFYKNDSSYKGYCWGISLVSQRFHRLATYLPDAPKKFQGENQDKERINEYKKIIAQINNNEPVTIPGFKSLRDFSNDPEVKDLLENSVKDQWAENALSSQGLKSVTSTTTPPKSELNQMFDDIEFRLKNNMSPAIVYNDKNDRLDSHVLLVSGTGTLPSGERYLCLNDNTFVQALNQNCNIKMVMQKDGSLKRTHGDNLVNKKGEPIEPISVGRVALTHSENTNLMEQISNIHTKCAGEKGCPKTL